MNNKSADSRLLSAQERWIMCKMFQMEMPAGYVQGSTTPYMETRVPRDATPNQVCNIIHKMVIGIARVSQNIIEERGLPVG